MEKAPNVLSIAVPNENVSELIQLKKEKDSLLLLEMQKHQMNLSALLPS
jgi:hypothetical protein